jgi:hypothetical protein
MHKRIETVTEREQNQVEKDTVAIYQSFLEHEGDDLLVLQRALHVKYLKSGLNVLPPGGFLWFYLESAFSLLTPVWSV